MKVYVSLSFLDTNILFGHSVFVFIVFFISVYINYLSVT